MYNISALTTLLSKYDDKERQIYGELRKHGIIDRCKEVAATTHLSLSDVISDCVAQCMKGASLEDVNRSLDRTVNLGERYSYGVNAFFIDAFSSARGFGKEKFAKSIWPYRIQRVIFNKPATIVYWQDGTKTVVKCNECIACEIKKTFKNCPINKPDCQFDKEKGLALCYMKKCLGNRGNYNDVFRQHLPKEVVVKIEQPNVYGSVSDHPSGAIILNNEFIIPEENVAAEPETLDPVLFEVSIYEETEVKEMPVEIINVPDTPKPPKKYNLTSLDKAEEKTPKFEICDFPLKK